MLSFPRDLYVTVDGGSKARINSAYRRDDPSRLQDTIFLNFQIPIDHYIQVDFCAFKRLVDGVGGVKVPFEYPARDTNTGLDVPASGGECFEFDGDHALAYVRSRHYEYLVDGEWKTDGTSDFGRISRQQDFLRRTVASLLGRGPFSPSVATALLQTNRQYLTIDTELTLGRMLEFAGVLRSLDPNAIASYQIESTSQNVSGQSVQIPQTKGENMQAILAIFRGEAPLAAAPDQIFESTTSAAALPGVTTGESAPPTATTAAGGRAGGEHARDLAAARHHLLSDRATDVDRHSSSARREGVGDRCRTGDGDHAGPRPATPAPRPRRCRRQGRRSRARRAPPPHRPRHRARWPGNPTATR